MQLVPGFYTRARMRSGMRLAAAALFSAALLLASCANAVNSRGGEARGSGSGGVTAGSGNSSSTGGSAPDIVIGANAASYAVDHSRTVDFAELTGSSAAAGTGGSSGSSSTEASGTNAATSLGYVTVTPLPAGTIFTETQSGLAVTWSSYDVTVTINGTQLPAIHFVSSDTKAVVIENVPVGASLSASATIGVSASGTGSGSTAAGLAYSSLTAASVSPVTIQKGANTITMWVQYPLACTVSTAHQSYASLSGTVPAYYTNAGPTPLPGTTASYQDTSTTPATTMYFTGWALTDGGTPAISGNSIPAGTYKGKLSLYACYQSCTVSITSPSITAGTTPVLKEGRNLALTAVPAGFPAGAEIQYSWTVESATAGAPAPAEIYGSASSVNVSVKSKPDASGSAIVKVSATCGTLTASATQTVSVVPFVVTVSGGTGDGATAHAGTEADPYILKYNGTDNTDATKITVTVSGNSGSIVARSNVTGLTIGHPASGDTTQHITISKTSLAATAIPAAGKTFKITVRDYEAGTAGAADNDDCLYAKRTFWVKIPQPDFTVSFNTGTGGSSAPADQTVTCGSYATAPANPTNTDTDLVFGGWYAGTAGAGGTVTLASTAFNFTTTAVTEDLTLYAKWLHTNFTGTAAEFLAAGFVPGNDASTPYTITITSATNDQLAEIALALGKSTNSNYKGGVYVNLDLAGCGATEIPERAFWADDLYGGAGLATYLTGITLPNNLVKLNELALYKCSALTGTLTIPATVEFMGYQCIDGTNFSGVSYEDTTSIWKKYDYTGALVSDFTPTTCPTLAQINGLSWRSIHLQKE